MERGKVEYLREREREEGREESRGEERENNGMGRDRER